MLMNHHHTWASFSSAIFLVHRLRVSLKIAGSLPYRGMRINGINDVNITKRYRARL